MGRSGINYCFFGLFRVRVNIGVWDMICKLVCFVVVSNLIFLKFFKGWCVIV